MRQERLLGIIKNNILTVEPGAEIYLYGPRISEDCDPDTSVDLLVILDHNVTEQTKRALQKELFRVELAIGSEVNLNIRQKDVWYSEKNQTQPFFMMIQKNAIKL